MFPRKAILITAIVAAASSGSAVELPPDFHGHTNNWAVLVDTSRFWFNYRHVANVLSVYRR